MRVAAWKDRGRHMSAWDMAVAFQWLYFHGSGDRRSGKVPLLGLDLLRCVDELSCEATELRCAMPREDDPWTFEDVRLKDALAKLEPDGSNLAKTQTAVAQRRPHRAG